MSYSAGDSFGYDQIQPNMQLDNYDSPYATIAERGLRSGPLSNPGAADLARPRLSGLAAGESPMCPNERPYRTFLPPSGPRWPMAEAVNPKVKVIRSSCPYIERRVPLDTDVAIRQGMSAGGSATARMMSALDIDKDDANFMLLLFVIILTISLVINNVNMRHLTKQVKLLSRGSLVVPLGASSG